MLVTQRAIIFTTGLPCNDMSAFIIRHKPMHYLLLVCLLLTGCAGGLARAVPAPPVYPNTQIILDSHGIPTLQAATWEQLVEAQGYISAYDRLWQMDLARRAAAGKLAAWFGTRAVVHDRKRREEDWQGVARQAYADLPANERRLVELYTAGVNHYIATHTPRWSREYALLDLTPEPWQPEDSLLILLQLAEILTGTAEEEAANTRWQAALSPAWFAWLFPATHPWNQSLFDPPEAPPGLPPSAEWLPPSLPELQRVTLREALNLGSNNWAWRDAQHSYLANDPHLLRTVPNLWYAVRLRVNAHDWAAGVSVPGVPGIVLGRSPSLAWAFTNTGEDVDDLLQETLSPDRKRYLAGTDAHGLPLWREIEQRPYQIEVHDAEPVEGVAEFTQRGPLARRPHLEGYYSRQWLGFQRGVLRLPAIALNRAHTWESANAAIDTLRIPAQNVLIADASGNLGYRVSGTGIERNVSGLVVQPALTGIWRGLAPVSERRRLLKPQNGASDWLATANQQLWRSPYGHYWSSDERAVRLRERLSGLSHATLDTMRDLQLDTQSHYYLSLTRWLLQHAKPQAPEAQQLLTRWQSWDGSALQDPEALDAARQLHRLLLRLLVSKVRGQLSDEFAQIPYFSRQQSALTLAVISHPDGFKAFGLGTQVTADWLLHETLKRSRADFPRRNRWQAQHPLAALPLLGAEFKVEESEQIGHGYSLRVEGPQFGATVRLLYDVASPLNDRISLPLGQSGHVASEHYQDLHADWFAGRYIPLLDPALSWGTPGGRSE